jgi:ComF family protein
VPFSLLDFLFPRRSLRGDEGTFLTEAEIEQLTSHPSILSKETLRARGIGSLNCVRIASTYSDCPLLRKAIWTFKYGKIPALGEQLAALLVPLVLDRCKGTDGTDVQSTSVPLVPLVPSVLCPVPLYFLRKFHRGFNQAELLAGIVSQRTGIPVRHCLRRTRWTGKQAGRTREQRLKALRGAFRVSGSIPRDICVILVDDITTTGATLEECARTLRRAGARRIEGLVVAHG